MLQHRKMNLDRPSYTVILIIGDHQLTHLFIAFDSNDEKILVQDIVITLLGL